MFITIVRLPSCPRIKLHELINTPIHTRKIASSNFPRWQVSRVELARETRHGSTGDPKGLTGSGGFENRWHGAFKPRFQLMFTQRILSLLGSIVVSTLSQAERSVALIFRRAYSRRFASREIMEIAVIPGNQCRRRVAQMSLLRAFNSGSHAAISANYEQTEIPRFSSQPTKIHTERLDVGLVTRNWQ